MTTKEPISSKQDPVLLEAAALWSACFDDDPEFVRFYFERIALAQELYLHRIEGRAIAHIHAPVYDTDIGGKAFYISGACTLSQYRGSGVMAELMRHTLREEHSRGCELALLIPADGSLESYYHRHFGFVSNIYRYTSTDLRDALHCRQAITSRHPSHSREGQCQFVRECLSLLPTQGLRHSLRQIDNVLEEYHRWAGVRLWTDSEGYIQELALYRELADTYQVDAFFGNTPERLADLTSGGKSLQITLPQPTQPRGGAVQRTHRGMMRLLDLPRCTERYAQKHTEATYTFTWLDDIISENTGTYIIEGGAVQRIAPIGEATPIEEVTIRLMGEDYWLAMMHE